MNLVHSQIENGNCESLVMAANWFAPVFPDHLVRRDNALVVFPQKLDHGMCENRA